MSRTLYQEWVQGPHLSQTRSVADSFVNLDSFQCSQKYADIESLCEISNVNLLDINQHADTSLFFCSLLANLEFGSSKLGQGSTCSLLSSASMQLLTLLIFGASPL